MARGQWRADPSDHFGVVVARFNQRVGERLLSGCLDTLARCGVAVDRQVDVVEVPGAWEIPTAGRLLCAGAKRDGHPLHGLVVLGAVVQGETPHFEVVVQEATQGSSRVGSEFGIPVGMGLLTTHTSEQAMERSGGKAGNKGSDAALAMLEMVDLGRRFTPGPLSSTGSATGP